MTILSSIFVIACSQPKHNEQQCGDMQKETCISREFFNDGYVNCPYPDCVDENGCSDTLEVYIVSIINLILIIFCRMKKNHLLVIKWWLVLWHCY